jgi:hypothetical protein
VNGSSHGLGLTAEGLRRAFDASFAAPHLPRRETSEAFLALTLGTSAYALRAREVLGLVVARKIIPIGSPITEMLGLAGIRGNLVPVYSLAALLGYSREEGGVRWFVLCQSAHPVALAFANFNGYTEQRSGRLFAGDEPAAGAAPAPPDAGEDRPGSDGRARPYVQEIVRDESGVREVIGIGPLVSAIAARAKSAATSAIIKEP